MACLYKLLSSNLFRRTGCYVQRMNVVLHHFTERGIYHTVPRDGRLAGELRRHDVEPVMPAAIACTGVSCVLMAFVNDLDLGGLQHVKQGGHLRYSVAAGVIGFSAIGHGVAHAGNVFLKGLTATCAYTPAVM